MSDEMTNIIAAPVAGQVSETGYDVFLKGALVDLVVLDDNIAHKTNWYRWFNDDETTQHMQKHHYPNTRAAQLEFVNDLRKDKNKIQLGMVRKDEGIFIGIISLQNIDWINRNAEVSILIGEEEGRKLIYAEEAMQLIIAHGFFALNLHKIYGGYLESLKSWGIFLSQRFGFQEEGCWREHVFKDGKYVHVYRIGLLREDYLAIQKNQGMAGS